MTKYRIHFGLSFRRSIKKLQKRFPLVKDDVKTAIGLLKKEPRSGAVIPGASGLRKLRVRNTDQQRGKSGGYRLIYDFRESPAPSIFLLLLYFKSDKSDVTKQELRELLDELAKGLTKPE